MQLNYYIIIKTRPTRMSEYVLRHPSSHTFTYK